MLKNTETSYSIISRILHWTVSIFIFTLLFVGYYMSDLPNSPEKFQIYGMHKAFGVLTFTLVIIRIIWRMNNILPKPVEGTAHWEEVASRLNFKVLYVLTVIMPLSGIFMSLYGGKAIDVFGLFIIPAFEINKKLSSLAKEFHGAFAVLLIVSLSMHISGALYHHFIKKDRTLKRIIVGK